MSLIAMQEINDFKEAVREMPRNPFPKLPLRNCSREAKDVNKHNESIVGVLRQFITSNILLFGVFPFWLRIYVMAKCFRASE